MARVTKAKRAGRTSVAAALIALGVASAACGSGARSGETPETSDPPGVATFHRSVEPILQKHCQGCHDEGGVAPFSLLTFEDAKRWGARVVAETQARRMPPWGALVTDECRPRFGFREDLHLSDQELRTIKDWYDSGMLEGERGGAPAARPQYGIARPLSRVDLELKTHPWTTAGSRDQFRCFVLDPRWTSVRSVTGVHIVPGNPKVVHHAIAFLDPGRESLRKMDADGGYECFAGPGVANTAILDAWAPGVPPIELGSQLSLRVPANALIVLQIHFHPLASPTPQTDSTALQLQTTTLRTPYLMDILLIGNFSGRLANGDGLLPGPNGRSEFLIPAGAKDYRIAMQYTLPAIVRGTNYPMPDLKVLGTGAHMHYVGTDLKLDIEHALLKEGETHSECMLQTPHWDFNWQRGYAYDTAIATAPEWRPNDKLKIRCTYDNSASNRAVLRALAEQGLAAPRDVRLGEQTLDEMCLATMSVAYVNPY